MIRQRRQASKMVSLRYSGGSRPSAGFTPLWNDAAGWRCGV